MSADIKSLANQISKSKKGKTKQVMYLSPTCFPEFSVSENRHDDQQVAQHVYNYSGDEHAGQQSDRPGEGETRIVSTG